MSAAGNQIWQWGPGRPGGRPRASYCGAPRAVAPARPPKMSQHIAGGMALTEDPPAWRRPAPGPGLAPGARPGQGPAPRGPCTPRTIPPPGVGRRPDLRRPGAHGTQVAAACRVLTRGGYTRADQLPPRASLWTGADWADARVSPSGHHHQRYRVELDSGQELACGKRQLWAVLDGGRLVARTTAELAPGDELFPFLHPARGTVPRWTRSLAESAALGRAVGATLGRLGRPLAAMVEDLFGASADDVLAFASGWAAAQCGHLIAPDPAGAAALQLLLGQAGVAPCTVVSREVFIPQAFAPRFQLRADSACFGGGNCRPERVARVASAHAHSPMYRIEFVGGAEGGADAEAGLPQSFVAGTALLLAPNASSSAEQGDSRTSSE